MASLVYILYMHILKQFHVFTVYKVNNIQPTSIMFSNSGSGLTLQLIRRNQQCNVSEALAPVDINLQYDFNYQQFTFLPREVQLLPVSFNWFQCNSEN